MKLCERVCVLAGFSRNLIWDSIAKNARKIVYRLEQSDAMSMDKRADDWGGGTCSESIATMPCLKVTHIPNITPNLIIPYGAGLPCLPIVVFTVNRLDLSTHIFQ